MIACLSDLALLGNGIGLTCVGVALVWHLRDHVRRLPRPVPVHPDSPLGRLFTETQKVSTALNDALAGPPREKP